MKDLSELSERGFSEILDFINSGVYVTDTDRRIVFWNKAAEEITGYKAEEVVGKHCRDNILVHVDHNGRPLCTTDLCPLYRAIARDRKSEGPVIIYGKTKSGERIPMSTSVAPVRDDDGQVIGGIEVFRDERDTIREMELAQTVQRQMVTQTPPEDERMKFAVEYSPRELVGGDICHIRRLDDDSFAVFVGDAAGHGPAAALYCSLSYSLLMECQDHLSRPAELMDAMNQRACERATGLGFMTAVCANINVAEPSVRYCAAGHPPILCQKAGDPAPVQLELSHLPIGTYEGATYEDETASLDRGDRLLFYTDGATDVRTAPEERLGINGLADLVGEHPPRPTAQVRPLLDAILDACIDVEPDDDITLVSCMLL